MVRRARFGFHRQVSAACHAAQARRCSLFLERRRSTRSCCWFAPSRTGCGRFTPYQRLPRRRQASFLRCASVVPRASCGLQRQASAACLARRRRVGARCLWVAGAALDLSRRARRSALLIAGSRLDKEHCAGHRPLSFGACVWCDVPPWASTAKLASHVLRGAGARRCSLSMGWVRSILACYAHAPWRAGCGRPMPRQEAPHRL